MKEIRADAGLFPVEVLAGHDTALVLFAAAFHGRQDAVWVAEKGLTATCVDHDADRLGEMVGLYPSGWEFVPADVFDYLNTDRTWDVVTVDCPTSLFARMADSIGRLCQVANHAVVLGTDRDTSIMPPEGWAETGRVRRSSSGVYWAVLQRS